MPGAKPVERRPGPAGRELATSGDALSQSLLSEPLDGFAKLLPGPVAASINRQSLRQAAATAQWPPERLPDQISKMKAVLARGPSLAASYRGVLDARLSDAVEIEALARHRARRTHDGRPTPLERWGGRLDDTAVASIAAGADARLAELRGKRSYHLDRLEAEAAPGDPFPMLAQAARRWGRQKGWAAATLVAAERRLGVLDLVGKGPPAAPPIRDTPAPVEALGHDAFHKHWLMLGNERYDPIVDAAIAIRRDLELADPAILWALQAEMDAGIAAVDGATAYEAQRLERELDVALRPARDLLNNSAIASAGEGLTHEWRAASESLEEASRLVERVEAKGQFLWDKGTHPDAALNRVAGRIAIGVAAGETLAQQRDQQREQLADRPAQEHLRSPPPREVAAAPGDAPDGIGIG